MRYIVLVFVFAGWFSTSFCQKPNIILIVTDDQGFGDIGLHGNQYIETPTLNKLANKSVRFDRFYVSPVCAPTRAALLTGRYPVRVGVTGVTQREEVMPEYEVTLAEILRANDYVTGCFGKWHNGSEYPFDPTGQGFDEFWGFTSGVIRNYYNTRLKHNTEPLEIEGYITDFLTEKAVSFIEQNQSNPFLCYVPYNVPHLPIQAPDSLFEKYAKKGLDEFDAGIYAMCENVDANIDKILNKLSELQIEENTIVLFLTDNGPNGYRYNAGMKGKKATVDEGGVRVPMWIKWGDHFPENKIVTELSAHIDLLPTLLDMCDIDLPDSLLVDGKSLLPLLLNEPYQWPERNLYTHWLKIGAVRNNRYRLVFNWNKQVELFDMLADPSQLNDISGLKPHIKDDLTQQYYSWLKDVKKNKSIPPIEVGHEQQKQVELFTTECKLTGELEYKNIHGWAYDWGVNWKSITDTFIWETKIVSDGMYEILLKYLVQEGDEGSKIIVQVGNDKLVKKIIEPFVPEPYPNTDNVDLGRPLELKWEAFSWGTLKLKRGMYDVKVSAESISHNSVGELYGLVIRKVECKVD